MHFWQQNTDDPLWVFPEENLEWRDKIVKEFRIHPVAAQILVSRGFKDIKEIHDYLYAKLPDLHDPFLMSEMPKAVERILEAIDKGENILIYGDNDVDGMTGTALLTDFLRYIGANVFYYVSCPSVHRQGLIMEALKYGLEKECKLLITVDCGITAAEEIDKITENGVDVIVTDHHEPTHTIPHCVATLNPKLMTDSYPNRDLTGVGVAFKLAHALTNKLVELEKIAPKKVDLKRYLDLVALGTIADMGALMGENRILVRYGIRQLRRTKRIGLAKLVSITDTELNQITTFTIASKIAPRLNSLGRIADPRKGVEMLLIRNAVAAEKLAVELDLNNIERQKIERTMSIDVDNTINEKPEILDHKAIIMESDKWHPGVIAILSTRISKHYNRPTIMIAIDEDGIGKGSLRSTHEFPLLPVLKENADLLINFGGHDFASGLTIKKENIPEFKKRFIEAADAKLNDKDVMSKLHIDAEVRFEDLTFDFMESVKLLEPFGNENPQPVLFCNAKQAWPPKVIGKTHLKFYLEQDERMLEGIAFGKASWSPKLRKKDMVLQVAFSPQVNNFQGPSIQLMIRDFKIMDKQKASLKEEG